MGSSASKGARTAGASARKYPTRPPPSTTRPRTVPPPPTQHPVPPGPSAKPPPPPQASQSKTEAIDLDARDPDFASRLSAMGAVQPNPHYSPSSTSSFDPQRNPSASLPSGPANAPPQSMFPDARENPALRVLEARQRIQDAADEELANVGRRGFAGCTYVDASAIQLALMRKARGEPAGRIEEALGLKKGRLAVLGEGIVGSVAAPGKS